jgi:hypothetical protein
LSFAASCPYAMAEKRARTAKDKYFLMLCCSI